jgi:hypothetical protein
LRSLRTEIDEGERDEGKEEKEGWRCRATVGCWFCDDDDGGGFDDNDDWGGGGLWATTCMAAKAIVSIFSASRPTPACYAMRSAGPNARVPTRG